MTDIEVLNQMIKDTARVALIEEYGRSSVILTEPQEPNSSVKISGIPSDAVVIKADVFNSPDAIFAGTRGECKRSDYIIITNTGTKKNILYIEMKKTKAPRHEVIAQLAGAQCLIRYCREIGCLFWKERNFLKDYKQRFICFGHTSIPKKKTRTEHKVGIHDTPEKMLKIDSPHRSQFNQLIGA